VQGSEAHDDAVVIPYDDERARVCLSVGRDKSGCRREAAAYSTFASAVSAMWVVPPLFLNLSNKKGPMLFSKARQSKYFTSFFIF